MWDTTTPTATFTDWNGNSWTVKELREIPTDYVLMKPIQAVGSKTFLDEIASRREVYGEGQEDQAYMIFDFNAEQITQRGFDLTTLKRILIPQPRTS